ncbi:glycosyltransferase [Nocardioides szechwanensis]|uniref:glycosyltransferase n=1 Tax=Nocardioides szechwanensis TaxID=1005944 RepID=UPI001478FDF6|nr:glycosyltransferase [Nocardioides szechwanensis]
MFDVAASHGGAMSVLSDFYDELVATQRPGKVYLVHSTGQFRSTESVRVLKYSWPKRNWIFRLAFDLFMAPMLIGVTRAERVVSLQNLMVPFTGKPQTLLVHTPLPFVDVRFAFREAPLLWVYQRIMAPAILYSIRHCELTIVQTRWMREAVLARTGAPSESVQVIPPAVPQTRTKGRDSGVPATAPTFFYPASDVVYKNHALVVEAVEQLQTMGLSGFTVIFTLTGNESTRIVELKRRSESLSLPIRYVGTMSREEALDKISKSVLVFPSYVETFGLPLLEARQAGCLILATDLPFAREVLAGYERAEYFDPFSAASLRDRMADIILGHCQTTGVRGESS